MKKLICILLALATILGVFAVITISTTAAVTGEEVKEMSNLLFENVAVGEFINNDYGTLKNGNPVRTWPYDGSTDIVWRIVKVKDNIFRIATNESINYCIDAYRGNQKLKKGQLIDIWKSGADAYAQNVIFYRCDNGSYIIRMAENPDLALTATGSKGRLKLAKFDSSNKYQQWIVKDTNRNKVDISAGSSTKVPVGISTDSFAKTGVAYTVNGIKYYQAETLRDYNGVSKNSLFFVDCNNTVVTNAELLNKLYSLMIFADLQESMKLTLEDWVYSADAYYDICVYIANSEKLGSLIGKASGTLLNIGIGNSYGIKDAVLDIGEEAISPDNIKNAILMGMLRVYSNDSVATGNQAIELMKNPVTDYEVMKKSVDLYAQCAANFAVIEHLCGDQVRELAKSSVDNELRKYFVNVVDGIADTFIPDIPSVNIAMYIEEGEIALKEYASKSGVDEVYSKKLVEYDKFTNLKFDSAKSVANKLSQPEALKFVKALKSKYTTNVTTQKWGAYYKGHGYHLGVDLGTSGNKSTDVVSIADGVVHSVLPTKKSYGYGNFVIVKHQMANGKVFYSGYGHMASVNVSVGATVSEGTKLGVMGNTGNSTGPHLHLLVFTKSGNVSKTFIPKAYVSKKLSSNTYTVSGVTYYNPLEVISSQGSIIK